MKVVIVGAGSLGVCYYYFLQQQVKCFFLKHKTIKTNFYINYQKQTIKLYPNYIDLFELKNMDLILVTTKANNVIEVLDKIKKYLKKNAKVILLNNGLVDLPVDNFLSTSPLINSATTFSAYKKDNIFYLTNRGKTFLSVDKNKELVNFFAQSSNLDVIFSKKLIYLKFAINCILNPLSALLNCKNKEFLKDKYKRLINKLINELEHFYQEQKIIVTKLDIKNFLNDVLLKTSENFSSMQQDLKHKKKTEIDYLNGYILQKTTIKVPAISYFYRKIKFLEKMNLSK